MVWSLSKDDDGLDSVLPLADEPIVVTPVGAPLPSVPQASRSGDAGSARPGGAPSVVVDPTSQVPEAPGGLRRPGGAVEATVVLKGRRLDNLRAEVARRRVQHQRKKQRVLLLWASAGGLALCLGWAVGTALSPSTKGDAGSGDSPAEDAAEQNGPADQDSEPSDDVKSPDAALAEAPPEDLGTLSLAEPSDEKSPPNNPIEPEVKADAPTDDGGDQTFTLDDLPAD